MTHPGAADGRLVLAATPIGNVGDASPRLRDALATADVIAAEDTRRTRRLLAGLAVTPAGRLLSFHEHNESERTPELVDLVAEGATVLVVTDAGMPSVSDPGYRLVAAAVAADLAVTCLPGPSAVLVALALSGLPVDRFCFDGFLPRRPGERARALADLATQRRTLVLFESPHRTEASLRAMAEVLGPDRRAALCRELTKTHEEVRRGTLAELADWAAQGVRGEVTLVVAGAPPEATDLASLLPGIRERVAAGERLKDVCAEVAAATGLSRKALYDAVLETGRRT